MAADFTSKQSDRHDYASKSRGSPFKKSQD
jgi:hypothetical protein